MNILLAVDGSEFSDAAIQNLVRTRPTDAQIRVIHVIEPLSFAYGGDIPMDFSGIQWRQTTNEF